VLRGLENLSILSLAGTGVADISDLRDLKGVTELSLHNTKVIDISPLRELTSLTELDLSGTDVTDISALRELKRLTMLDLGCLRHFAGVLRLFEIAWQCTKSHSTGQGALMRINDQITTVIASSAGMTLTTRQVQTLVLQKYPVTNPISIIPSDHSGPDPRSARSYCHCSENPSQIFMRENVLPVFRSGNTFSAPKVTNSEQPSGFR
jgi:Leucine-rich repeat (LRR) protein